MQFHYVHEVFLKRRFHANQTGLEREECLRSLIKVFSNIRSRTEATHPRANAAARRRLAAQWSHLANNLAGQRRFQEASSAARTAYGLEPRNIKRIIKAALLSFHAYRGSLIETPA
jgi:hypothetical protein